MGRDRSRSRERRGDRDRDEKGRGGDRRDDRGDDRRDSRRDDRGGDKRDDRGGDKRDDRGDERRRERSGERRRERSGERAPASGKQYKTEEELMQLAKPEKKEDKDRDREGKDRDRPSKKEEVEEKDDDEYRVGRQVMVRGLQKNPEKNGSIGQLVEFNKEKGRWVVAMGGGNNNFKEENLELMADNSDVVDENQEPPTAKVYITKLSAEVTAKDLLVLFGGCGLIEKEPPKSGPKGFRDTWPDAVKLYKPGRDGGDACVTYMDGQSAKAAIKCFHRYKFKGSKIGVAYAGEGKTYEKTTELQKPWFMREENQGKLDREGGGGGGKDGGKSGPKPGDWKCEGCGADVFASKDSCFKCGSPKPAGGGGSSGGKDGGKGGDKGGKDGGKDGGKGGGKAGDWTCPGCAANVFASKDSCFKCGESRPGGGGGGGGGKGGGRW